METREQKPGGRVYFTTAICAELLDKAGYLLTGKSSTVLWNVTFAF